MTSNAGTRTRRRAGDVSGWRRPGASAAGGSAVSRLLIVLVAGCAPGVAGGEAGEVRPGRTYEAWVASEAVDEVALIRFDGESATVAARRGVGSMPVEIDGPHGVAVSPDGQFIYVTLGHGLPNGSLVKIDARTHQIVGRTPLGLFPATVAVTPDGAYGFVSNFNLHGDHVPSSISMVHLGTMAEVARVETCVMPHGSRVEPGGARHYSVCMMDERVVELDATTADRLRQFSVARGREGPVAGTGTGTATHEEPGCSPTWVEPAADGASIFVTCNRAAEVIEIDVGGWRIARRFETGENPYNLAVTPDGRLLLVSLRSRTEPALEIIDLGTGTRTAHVPLSTTLGHGIAVTDDSRFAFVTVEGVGSEPGKVDVVDLRSFRVVSSVEVGQQATGVAAVPSSPRS